MMKKTLATAIDVNQIRLKLRQIFVLAAGRFGCAAWTILLDNQIDVCILVDYSAHGLMDVLSCSVKII